MLKMLPVILNLKLSLITKHLLIKLIFHLFNLVLIKLYRRHQILMLIPLLLIHVYITLADPPMRHSCPVYMVQLV